MQRRQLLRYGLYGLSATLLGCRPSEEPTSELPAPRAAARARSLSPEQPETVTPTDQRPATSPAPRWAAERRDESLEALRRGEPRQRVRVICRDALGLEEPARDERRHELRLLTLHHTAAPLPDNRKAPERLRGHQAYHRAQGWPDIAYHYGVDQRGNVYELRAVDRPGDTFTDYDPGGHFLVVCEGNYDQQQPTDAMLAATAEILAHGAATYGLGADSLTGHRDHAATTCPGDALQSRLGELRDEVARLIPRGAQRHDVCGQDATALVAAIEAG